MKDDYKIIVDNVYKTFNVYLDKANTIKEKILFLFSRNRKEKREILKGKKVAIIGGGPAGLTSAAFLAKDGVRSYNF